MDTEVLIVGASVAGLASAATMSKEGIPYVIIEKTDNIGTPWRNHYDRLHLHTHRNLSNLPYKKFKKGTPSYPSRLQVVEYLEEYRAEFNINPVYNTEATKIYKSGEHWITETTKATYRTRFVIVASGPFGRPKQPNFPGLESFTGEIIHSSVYKSGRVYKDEDVLVVGFGNSACEIAIDLHEQGAKPSMSVRSAVNVLPKEVFGIPTLSFGVIMSKLPPRLADKMNEPLINMLVGDIRKLGLKRLPYGAMEQIAKYQTVPLLDIGTIKLLREGHITIFEDIEKISGDTVYFKDGKSKDFVAIVAAIGYNKGTQGEVIQLDEKRFKDLTVSVDKQKYFGKDGLYFCGFWISSAGQIREIRLDAIKIAKDISKHRNA